MSLTSQPTRITVVESEGCHFCEDAHLALAEAAHRYPLDITTVDALSESGQRLMQVHRAWMSPLVLLDGEFFSHGRLPRRKLAAALARRGAGPLNRPVG
ncbi:MAG TPA: glutaredoxin [Nocardioidaceae bacterium]|nr:glutaredoxin [Nocardioidaceae bacterium]